jgi:hypothetical protein
MATEAEIERAQREELRWRVLAALNAGRPKAVTESLILRIVQDVSLPATMLGLRREFEYLEKRKLITVNRGGSTWLAELTTVGIDLVEYTIPVEPGIARPERY